jgi:PilZ domain
LFVRRDCQMAHVEKEGLPTLGENASVRRRHERIATRVRALLHCHGRFQTVRIVDFSLGGLQLEGCFGIGAGDDIVVELLSGHQLTGKCMWSVGSRVGVRFLEALSADHPALTVLRQGTRRIPENVAN